MGTLVLRSLSIEDKLFYHEIIFRRDQTDVWDDSIAKKTPSVDRRTFVRDITNIIEWKKRRNFTHRSTLIRILPIDDIDLIHFLFDRSKKIDPTPNSDANDEVAFLFFHTEKRKKRPFSNSAYFLSLRSKRFSHIERERNLEGRRNDLLDILREQRDEIKWMWVCLELDWWWSLQLQSTDGKRERRKHTDCFHQLVLSLRFFFVFSSVYANEGKHHWTFQSLRSNWLLIGITSLVFFCSTTIIAFAYRLKGSLPLSFPCLPALRAWQIEDQRLNEPLDYLTSTPLQRSKDTRDFFNRVEESVMHHLNILREIIVYLRRMIC